MVFFGASNRPDLMDDALLRFGRIDAIIPVLLPEEPERLAIAQATARSLGFTITAAAAEFIAVDSDKYSAADVAQVVIKASKIVKRTSNDPTILTAHAQAAARTLRPATPAKADYFTMLAVQACNDTELLPPRYAALLDDRGKLQETIQAATDTTQTAVSAATRSRREL